MQEIDWNILYYIQDNLTGPVMDTVMPMITRLGDKGFIWFLISFIMICQRKYRMHGIMLFIAIMIGVVIGNGFMKNFFERPRPTWLDPSVQLLIDTPHDYSFPSGHTLASFIAATYLLLIRSRIGIISMILAILIGFSRLYLFVHFPSDVLMSVILGITIAFVSYKFIYPFLARKIMDSKYQKYFEQSDLNN